jgi:NadR type nicotinamide-nucleotide adenylyltransferase
MEKALTQEDSDCIKVVLYGPESSGKTTLAKALAESHHTEWVPEYMRSYLQTKWDDKKQRIEKVDLLPIAKGQISSENEITKKANRVVFCDTNLRELKVYSTYYYDGFCPSEILRAVDHHNYDHYFLTQIDTPWEADDLRDRPYDRKKLFRIFEQELLDCNLPYTLLEGSLSERIQKATQVLQTLKQKKNAREKGG